MSWHLAAAGRRIAVALIAMSCALGCLGTTAFAQNACRPEDEIFGGYAFLFPNGWGDLDYKINNIPNAFDASNTYYLRNPPISDSSWMAAATFSVALRPLILSMDRMTPPECPMHWEGYSTNTTPINCRPSCAPSSVRPASPQTVAVETSGISRLAEAEA